MKLANLKGTDDFLPNEQIIRNKKVMSDNDKAIVAVARSIKEFYL